MANPGETDTSRPWTGRIEACPDLGSASDPDRDSAGEEDAAGGSGAREFRLAVGRTVLAIDCPSTAYAASIRSYFAAPPTERDADLTLELEVVTGSRRDSVPDSLFQDKKVRDGDFEIADGLVSGSFDPASRRGVLKVHWSLTKGRPVRVFEQILYQAFWSAARIRDPEACLVHSCGVIRDGAGYLFVGPSGAGKSTVAELSRDDVVLNDEIALLRFEADGLWLESTPFNGFFPGKRPGRAPLKAILTLFHGKEHRLEEMAGADAMALLASQLVPPMGLDEDLDKGVRNRMLDWAHRLASAVPVRRLVFLPDAGFWPLIDSAFGNKE